MAQAEYEEQFELVYGHLDRARETGQLPKHSATNGGTSKPKGGDGDSDSDGRRRSVSFAVAKVSDGEDGISIEFTTRQVS